MFSSFWDWFLLLFCILCLVLWYAKAINSYFDEHGVISTKNPLPFFGHMLQVFLGKEHLLQTVYRAYNSHPNEKFFGFYAFNRPTLVIKDLDMIKKITVKDFDHFLDHKVFMDEDDDPLFGKNLFFLKGQKWRDMRIAMSPAYTGSKMKNMLPFVQECAQQMIIHLKNKVQNDGGEYLQVEMKDVFTRFTNDVIASTAFGVKVNSLEDKTNEFYRMGKKATDFSGIQFLKFFGYSSCPRLMKLMGISLFPENVKSFFRKIVYDAIEKRETMKYYRPDLIHLLMLAKKGSLNNDNDINSLDDFEFIPIKDGPKKEENIKREWSHDDLTAQALAFLLAGFDTSSTLLCFTAYELATHPEIQKRLQGEIDGVIESGINNPNYVDLQKMKYLDMVISESLRMWPPDSQLERVCTKPYTMPPQNDMASIKYEVNHNDDLWIPIYSIQHDARYHPDPENFNPERFSTENKPFMHPFSFIPFGVGPRICIGARFAVMEAKVLIFNILTIFDIIVIPKTTYPIQLAANTFTLHSADGFWLGLKLREKNTSTKVEI